MSYNIEGAILHCRVNTKRKVKDIKADIIKELGGDPNNSNHKKNLWHKITKNKSLQSWEFRAICKACDCPAYVLADTEK
jgi:hypothetical protein